MVSRPAVGRRAKLPAVEPAQDRPTVTASSGTDPESWAVRFDERAGQHAEVQSVDVAAVDRRIAELLGPSLAIFQLGESGSGEHLFDAARRAATDLDYRRCLERFVAEEQEHARMLGVVLDSLGEPRRHHHWTDGVFVLIRRAHSLRTEILVLMVAEVVALSYYGALAEHVSAPDLADVFARIHADEVVHVDFHSATLPGRLQRFPRPVHAVVRLAWSVLVAGAAVVVAKDHGGLLARLGVPRRRFLRQVLSDRRRVAAALFRY